MERTILRFLRGNAVLEHKTPLKNLFPIGSKAHKLAMKDLCRLQKVGLPSTKVICSQRTVGDVLDFFSNGNGPLSEEKKREMKDLLRRWIMLDTETPLEQIFRSVGSVNHLSAISKLSAYMEKETPSDEVIYSQQTVGDVLDFFTNRVYSKAEGAQESEKVSCTA